TITNNVWQAAPESLVEPSALGILAGLGAQVFHLAPNFPLLGSLQSFLEQPLPLIDESVAQLTGLDGELPEIPSLGSLDPSSFLNSLAAFGIQVNDGHTSPGDLVAMVDHLVRGQLVDLVSWSES